MSVDAAKEVLGYREKEKRFLQAGKCRQSRTGQVSLARLVCVTLSDMFKPSNLILIIIFSLCSDQSAMKNVFDFLQDYVPQVGIFPNLIRMHHDIIHVHTVSAVDVQLVCVSPCLCIRDIICCNLQFLLVLVM